MNARGATAPLGGNLTSLTKRDGQNITLAYDALNRLTGRSHPTAAHDVGYAYDLLNRKTAATSAGGSVGYVWDRASRLATTTAGGKTVAYQYDAAGKRTGRRMPAGCVSR